MAWSLGQGAAYIKVHALAGGLALPALPGCFPSLTGQRPRRLTRNGLRGCRCWLKPVQPPPLNTRRDYQGRWVLQTSCFWIPLQHNRWEGFKEVFPWTFPLRSVRVSGRLHTQLLITHPRAVLSLKCYLHFKNEISLSLLMGSRDWLLVT